LSWSRTSSRKSRPRTPEWRAIADTPQSRPSARASDNRGSRVARRAARPARPSACDRAETWPPNDRCLLSNDWKALQPEALRSPVTPSEYDVLRADHRHHVGQHVAFHHLLQRGEMRETGRAAFQAIGLVRAVRHQIDAELALGRFDRRVGLA